MNPNPLPYENEVLFSTEPIQAIRDIGEVASENDIVLIFEGQDKQLLAFAAGFRNLGFFIGLVMAFGAPIGFGKVLYIVNGQSFVNYALFPLPHEEITVKEDPFSHLNFGFKE